MRLSYVICGSPRTGGNLLCDLLRQAGDVGVPSEVPGPPIPSSAAWATLATDDDLRPWIQEVHRTMTVGDVFGIYVHYTKWAEVLLPEAETVQYIFLYRRDPVQQAISWHIAQHTGVWRSTSQPQLPDEVLYNRARIASLTTLVQEKNQAWEDWFSKHNVLPHRLSFEHLVQHRVAAVQNIYRFLGGQFTPSFQTELHPQRTALNDEFLTRYLAGN